jgi:hypothetical protein
MAYDRVSGEVVGRGGLSRTPVDDAWGQIYSFRQSRGCASRMRFAAHSLRTRNWLEIGWALRREFWGRGYASEIGRAGLAFAFDVLGVHAVVSCTVRDNVRSRAVMERIGMRYAGEIPEPRYGEGVEGEQGQSGGGPPAGVVVAVQGSARSGGGRADPQVPPASSVDRGEGMFEGWGRTGCDGHRRPRRTCLCSAQRVETLGGQQFVAEAAVERFAPAVLPWRSGFDGRGAGAGEPASVSPASRWR